MIFNSTIITNNSFYRAELASFLAPAVGLMESKWKLCYNALSDGWRTEVFHMNCDNRKHTFTIIEKKPYIFGGYTDIPWSNYQFLFMNLSWTNQQIDSMLLCVYPVDHRRPQIAATTTKKKKKKKRKKKVAHHAVVRQVSHISSYHILISSRTYYLTDAWQYKIDFVYIE